MYIYLLWTELDHHGNCYVFVVVYMYTEAICLCKSVVTLQ